MKDIVHIYHYNTHSEKSFFAGIGYRDYYDLVSLKGNIVSHSPQGTASFLTMVNKPFFIDPQTHIFQHPTIHLKRNKAEKGKAPELEFKSSIRKLAGELGGVFEGVLDSEKPLNPSNFKKDNEWNDELIADVCKKAYQFQTEIINESLDEETKEFLDGSSIIPEFLIAPYFYLSPKYYNEWLSLNERLYKCFKEVAKTVPYYYFLVVSKEALNKDREKIITSINTIKPDGILLWIDDHDEEVLTSFEIKNYLNLVKGLKDTTSTIYNINGGYFSILLCHRELGCRLDGVGHGINYGEHRGVIPVGGGIPMARFYFPSLHSRLRYGDALGILDAAKWLDSSDTYFHRVCQCKTCLDIYKASENQSAYEIFSRYGDSNPVTFRRRSGSIVRFEYPTTEAKNAAAWHYLHNKNREFEEVRNNSLDELIGDLQTSYNEITPYSGDEMTSHLIEWKEAIERI